MTTQNGCVSALYQILKLAHSKNYDQIFKHVYNRGMQMITQSKQVSPDALNFLSYCIQNGGINRAVKNVGDIIHNCNKILNNQDQGMIKSKEAASYLLSQIASSVHDAADLVYDNFGSNVTQALT